MTATVPAGTGLRQCRLYRFYVTHPLTGETVLGYIGETGRQPFERLLEHLATQPWFDTVVRWEIDPQIYWGKDAVLRAETAAIHAELPLYNVKKNERNDQRIIPPVAIRQRRARDAQRGGDRWVHPDDRDVQSSTRRPRPSTLAPATRRPLKPWQKAALGWAAAWVATTVTAWLLMLHWRWGTVGHTLVASACVLPTALLVIAFLEKPARKKITRRRRSGRSR